MSDKNISFGVPMIQMPQFTVLSELEINDTYFFIDQSIVDSRNVYALGEIFLLCAFRKIIDLNENGKISYWEKFLELKRRNQLQSNASEVLHNIKGRCYLRQIARREYNLESKFNSFEGMVYLRQNTCCNDNYSSDNMNISEMIPKK